MSEPVVERPDIVAGYGVDDAPEGLLAWSWAEERLREARNFWVASTRPDGRPHVAPVWAAWEDDALWFGTDPGSVKARNLRSDPRVVVHLESGDEVVVVEGTVEHVEVASLAEDVAARVDASFARRYRDGESGEPFHLLRMLPADAVILRVVPATVLGWLETDFRTTPTRWRFRS